jgi:hypothetical protein
MNSRVIARVWFIAFLTSFFSTASHALVVSIDQFSVTRNGSTFFTDPFSDGNPPPSAPSFPQTNGYGVQGTIPANAESGGLLQLDTANGVFSQNAVDSPRLFLGVTLLTNTDTTNTTLGLKSGDTLGLSAIFSLTTPTGPLFSDYGIRFIDSPAGGGLGSVHQALQLFVRFDQATQQDEVAYILQDYDAQTITLLGSTLFAPPAGADEIQLTLTRPDTTNNNFTAEFSYLQNGAILGGPTDFATPGQMFQGENYVRAQFFAAQGVVPEPSTGWLGLVGLLMLAATLRRRKESQDS